METPITRARVVPRSPGTSSAICALAGAPSGLSELPVPRLSKVMTRNERARPSNELGMPHRRICGHADYEHQRRTRALSFAAEFDVAEEDAGNSDLPEQFAECAYSGELGSSGRA